MNLLTDDEISLILERRDPNHRYFPYDKDTHDFARAIEAAVLAKFEVVVYGRFDEDDNGRLCGALDFENPPLYVTPLYALKEKP